MARQEIVVHDALFFDATARRAVHVSISPRITRAIKEMFSEPNRRTCNVLAYRSEPQGEERAIPFTDVLVAEVYGPGHKPPEGHVL